MEANRLHPASAPTCSRDDIVAGLWAQSRVKIAVTLLVTPLCFAPLQSAQAVEDDEAEGAVTLQI